MAGLLSWVLRVFMGYRVQDDHHHTTIASHGASVSGDRRRGGEIDSVYLAFYQRGKSFAQSPQTESFPQILLASLCYSRMSKLWAEKESVYQAVRKKVECDCCLGSQQCVLRAVRTCAHTPDLINSFPVCL